jgi:hypothetical protein
LFEKLPFKTFKPTQASGNRLLMGFEGKLNNGKDRPKTILKMVPI